MRIGFNLGIMQLTTAAEIVNEGGFYFTNDAMNDQYFFDDAKTLAYVTEDPNGISPLFSDDTFTDQYFVNDAKTIHYNTGDAP